MSSICAQCCCSCRSDRLLRRHLNSSFTLCEPIPELCPALRVVTLNVLYLLQPSTTFGFGTLYNATYGLLMYGSYLYLFCAFFYNKYMVRTKVR